MIKYINKTPAKCDRKSKKNPQIINLRVNRPDFNSGALRLSVFLTIYARDYENFGLNTYLLTKRVIIFFSIGFVGNKKRQRLLSFCFIN